MTGADVIACGEGFACAHTGDGHTLCWGDDGSGQLGRGTTSVCELAPAPVLAEDGAPLVVPSADLAAAGAHACVLAFPSGALSCWGRNDDLIDVRAGADMAHVYTRATDALGALRDAPTTPLPAASVTLVSVARRGAVARITGRDLYGWGENFQLEVQSPAGARTSAILNMAAGRGVIAVAGRTHRCAIDGLGVVCWGGNGRGQLGHPSTSTACGGVACESPGAPMGAFTLIAASGDGDTTCGLGDAGTSVRCWGDNQAGLAGVPSTTPIAYLDGTVPPVPLPTDLRTPIARLFVGPYAACVVDAAAQLWCWGDHDLDATTPAVTSPVRLAL